MAWRLARRSARVASRGGGDGGRSRSIAISRGGAGGGGDAWDAWEGTAAAVVTGPRGEILEDRESISF